MSELINSSANFYLNAETYNPTANPIDAVITISDRDDILKFQEHWAVHCTRFAVDTQASLYYVIPDDDIWLTLTCVEYTLLRDHRTDTSKHFVDQRTLRMTDGASTLANFLEQLNENVPIINRTAFRNETTLAGAQEPWKCGVWTVTPSGAFKFQAKFYRQGATTGTANFDQTTEEFMVNIKMSEKMRKILAFKQASCRVQGERSGFRRWKEMLANFTDQLPAYRKNIKNWRWEGHRRHWHLNNWYNEMWYIINNVILRGIPLNRLGYVDQSGGHRNDGVFHRDEGFITGVDFWEEEDFALCNYVSPWGRGAAGGYADSSHAHTHFARVSFIGQDLHGHDHLGFRDLDDIPLGPKADHRWSSQQDQDGQLYATEGAWITTVHNSGATSYWFNAKQTWGSWSRAYILNVVNQRQIHINKAAIDPGNVTGPNPGNVGGGGLRFGIPPKVGDTIYIPGSANLDGTGSIHNYVSDYNSMQRGIITAVQSSSVLRAPNLDEDESWLVTFDTQLELNGERISNLGCRQNDGGANATGTHRGDPQARVVYGTRRIPFQPMVYISETDANAVVINDILQFSCTKEFPVSIGDNVYIGHTPQSSEVAHLVVNVDYAAGVYQIQAHGIQQLDANTVVIGMVRDEIYDAVMATDKTCLLYTSPSPRDRTRSRMPSSA